jgi:beta-galactosidase/beta-glucuronidase
VVLLARRRVVAVQVEFENPNFETSFSLYRLKGWVTKRLSRYGSNCIELVQPPTASWGSRQYGSSHSPLLSTIIGLAITLGTGPNPTPGLPWA